MKMFKPKNKKISRIAIITGLFVIVMLYISQVQLQTIEISDRDNPEIKYVTFTVHLNRALGEYAGAGNTTTWREFYIIPHQVDPGTTYATNDSATLEALAYGYTDVDAVTVTIPSETAVDFVMRGQWDRSIYDNTDGQWVGTRARIKLTASGDVTISDQIMTLVETHNDSAKYSYFANGYLNNGGSGYTISDDGNIAVNATICEKY